MKKKRKCPHILFLTSLCYYLIKLSIVTMKVSLLMEELPDGLINRLKIWAYIGRKESLPTPIYMMYGGMNLPSYLRWLREKCVFPTSHRQKVATSSPRMPIFSHTTISIERLEQILVIAPFPFGLLVDMTRIFVRKAPLLNLYLTNWTLSPYMKNRFFLILWHQISSMVSKRR